jgi:hypothetical protein
MDIIKREEDSENYLRQSYDQNCNGGVLTLQH